MEITAFDVYLFGLYDSVVTTLGVLTVVSALIWIIVCCIALLCGTIEGELIEFFETAHEDEESQPALFVKFMKKTGIVIVIMMMIGCVVPSPKVVLGMIVLPKVAKVVDQTIETLPKEVLEFYSSYLKPSDNK